ncbi:hypothetical protein IT779_04760 [Nocardia sp. NEAU-351]|uniref:SAP domain-containing protein n=1 Tax=Nocardia bovistercoris TaxID=2785916 RepID=A0A931I7C5_9NOCA|nr:hypothetical protein [Nocardia bovistercoris]
MDAAELRRWYWLKQELADFARTSGIRATGDKQLLTDRIAAALDGVAFTEPAPPPPAAGAQLRAPFDGGSRIPVGQRCSQPLRAWFTEQVGPGFCFDAPMREFFAGADGSRTLADGLEHWYGSRDQGEKSIDSQFEYNRFTRAWHRAHPNGARSELVAAWQEYRGRPVDERGRV